MFRPDAVTLTPCADPVAGDQARKLQRVSFEVSFPYARPCGMLMGNMRSTEKILVPSITRAPFVGGRTA